MERASSTSMPRYLTVLSMSEVTVAVSPDAMV
jgi:hypothetical protein